MVGRSAMIWAGVLVGGLTLAAADPAPPVPDPALIVPPLPGAVRALPAPPPPFSPPTIPPLPKMGPAAPSSVTAFQLPAEPPPPPVIPGAPTQPKDEGLEPFLPQPPQRPEVILPEGARVNLPATTRQVIRVSPRYGKLNDANLDRLPDGTQRVVYTGGVIINIVYLDDNNRSSEVELATDNAVGWIKGADKDDNVAGRLNTGAESGGRRQTEFYLQGNVVIRTISIDVRGQRNVEEVLRAKELYYEVNLNRAVALDADLELTITGLPEPVHFRGDEMWQLGPNEWRAFQGDLSASKRPSDPALRITSAESTLTRQRTVRTNIFGRPYRNLRTGEPDFGYEQILTSERVRLRVFDTPILFYPRIRTDVNEPLGPLVGIGFGNDGILGFQVYTTWDVYKIIARRPPQGHRWVLYADYLSDRGPALGTEYSYTGPDFLGFGQQHAGFLRMYGIHDEGFDQLGGDRGPEPVPPTLRGRIQWRHNQDLYENGTTFLRALAQVQHLSDMNFLEQYYKFEFDMKPNQESFAYVYGAAGNLGGSVLYQQNLNRRWITETEWKPRLDGYVIGQDLLDIFTYSARADAGYAELIPATEGSPSVFPTDQRVDAGRFHLNQRLSVPFDLGPLRLDPYGVLDLAHYTEDLTGDSRGRLYAGGGARASLSFARLYPTAESELFNVRGLNHKLTYGANYLAAYSDTPYTRLPQFDRLHDDATDFGYRTTRPRQTFLIGGEAGQQLATSELYDSQRYAIRRLVENKVDTLDDIEVLQLELNQRLQTKRGFPGAEHTVDWMTLNLSGSLFPEKARDNFGEGVSFLEYYYLWHLGDRLSLSSAGWSDPMDFGARYFNIGANFSRPDGTTFFLGYRKIDPVDSRALTAVINYQLSRKYSMTFISVYDFGQREVSSNQVSIVRTGTDLTVMFGISYNALLNNFGVQFAVVPNLLGMTGLRLAGATPGLGQR